MSLLNLEIIIFIFNGLVGAVLRELLEDNKFRTREWLIRIIFVGAISGYIYYLLYSSYGFPDRLMALVFGYFSYDLLPRIFKELKKVINNRKQL